jgi:hypothetical protein
MTRARRLPAFVTVTALLLLLPACQSDPSTRGFGHFSIFGYSTKPNYNCDIRTIYVPIFKNRTFYRGLEFDLTRAVVREIEAKTPYKVTSNCDGADSELIGTITTVTKAIVNINPQNEVREAEMTLSVEVIWRDRRTGEVLSRQAPPRNILAPGNVPPAGPALNGGVPGMTPPIALGSPEVAPPYLLPDDPVTVPPVAPPVLIQSVDHYIPELGQSTASALTGTVDRVAIQIVSMMENPW